MNVRLCVYDRMGIEKCEYDGQRRNVGVHADRVIAKTSKCKQLYLFASNLP